MNTGASLYCRKDGRWEARYKKFRGENGRMVYGYVYGSTKEEAINKREEAIRALSLTEQEKNSLLPTVNPDAYIINPTGKLVVSVNKEKIYEPLSNEQVEVIEQSLLESDDPMALGLYLSLHMGLSTSEICALRYGDIDIKNGEVTISHILILKRTEPLLEKTEQRIVIMPHCVKQFLSGKGIENKNPLNYVMSDDEKCISAARTIATKLKKIIKQKFEVNIATIGGLRSTFVCRCLETNMNIESVSAISGIEKSTIYKCFGNYIKGDSKAILRLEHEIPDMRKDKFLNLLIIGAGSHGRNVKELAEKLGVFNKIKFLDDNKEAEDIVGRFEDYKRLAVDYPCAFVALGDNKKRKIFSEKLKDAGYMLPHLIHPDATVSKNAKIGEGSIVLAQATINAAEIGDLCIVASNALVNFGAKLGDYSHVDCGGIVMKDANVPPLTFVESGEIYNK